MDSTFVRKDFYIDPPKPNATAEEWLKWMDADKRKAIAAKRAHTMSLNHAETPEELQESGMRKVDGKWTQSVCVGVSGTEDNYTLEPQAPARQEQGTTYLAMEAERHKRGGKRAGKSRRRRINRRKRKEK